MSTYLHLRCTDCEFQSDSTVLFGFRSYKYNETFVSIEITLGWCFTCKTFNPVEVLSTPDHRAEIGSEVDQMENKLLAAKLDAEERKSWYKRLFNLKTELAEDLRRLEVDIYRKKEIAKKQSNRLQALAKRKSPPRCLSCGATNVEFVSEILDRHSKQPPEKPIYVGILHPGCGGRIVGEPIELLVSWTFERHVYNTEGELIHVEQLKQ